MNGEGLIGTEPSWTQLQVLGAYLAYQTFWNKSPVHVYSRPNFTDDEFLACLQEHRVEAVIGSAYLHKECISASSRTWLLFCLMVATIGAWPVPLKIGRKWRNNAGSVLVVLVHGND